MPVSVFVSYATVGSLSATELEKRNFQRRMVGDMVHHLASLMPAMANKAGGQLVDDSVNFTGDFAESTNVDYMWIYNRMQQCDAVLYMGGDEPSMGSGGKEKRGSNLHGYHWQESMNYGHARENNSNFEWDAMRALMSLGFWPPADPRSRPEPSRASFFSVLSRREHSALTGCQVELICQMYLAKPFAILNGGLSGTCESDLMWRLRVLSEINWTDPRALWAVDHPPRPFRLRFNCIAKDDPFWRNVALSDVSYDYSGEYISAWATTKEDWAALRARLGLHLVVRANAAPHPCPPR